MTLFGCPWGRFTLAAGLLMATTVQAQEPLTADRAVQIALEKNSSVIGARANSRDARAGEYSAASGVLPRLSANYTRGGQYTKNRSGQEFVAGLPSPSVTFNDESYSTVPQLTGIWNVLDLSAWKGLSSARTDRKAAGLFETATRNDIALAVRRAFYDVVGSIHLAGVNAEALRLSRDNERRVRALFEVGSVSKSDVLKAQVRTAQSQLDSLTAGHRVTTSRIALAETMGIAEQELGTVDTTLTVAAGEYRQEDVLAEAEKHRPDIQAAEAQVRAAKSAETSAKLAWIPYLTVSGTAQYNQKFSSTTTYPKSDTSYSTNTEIDDVYRGAVALNWDFFNGMSYQARSASAQARRMRAEDTRDALRRNLAAEVEQTLLSYREALESWEVAQRAVESGSEDLKLTQQKYNVGSATILDLIDAQVSLQRAQSQEVVARAGIRVAEAAIRRVSGRAD